MRNTRNDPTTAHKKKEPLRLLALSDGLFATVLTLLVLDLRVPETVSFSGGTIHVFVKWIGPRLFSYLLTFLVSGNYWLTHHRDFDHIDGYDRGLLAYNLLFLLFIGLLPFSTAAIGPVNFRSGAYPFFWAIYASNIMLAGVMLALTWNYAVSHKLLKAETSISEVRHINVRQAVTPSVFLVSIVAQYSFPGILLGPYILLVIPALMWLVDWLFAAGPTVRTDQGHFSRFLWRVGSVVPWLLIIGLAIWAMNI